MLGQEVQTHTINYKSSETVLDLRRAFDKVEILAKWLANQQVVAGNDPLVTVFNYTADEAYLLRTTFEQLEALRLGNLSLFETARKLTGLE